jgi:hypothetical protein
MSLLNYWPSLNEINKCIKSEAENASDEVLLAVHQQFPLAHLTVGADGRVMPESRTVATEEDLLNYFIGDAPSGSHVLPITGASGVGKSHLIRMIDARLHRLQDANRYLVIRIPKSASLRRVVELILEAEPLKDSKYDHVKAEFTKALADIRLDEAVIRFQAQLEIALNEEALRLKQSLAQDPTNVSVKERLAHARDLPKLMSDAETVMHFRLNVLPRIIQRSVEGVESEGEEKEIDSTTAQFRVDDLNLGSLDIGRANTQVANYYRLNLDAREGRGKAIAISVLNDVVDIATRQLYQLNQSFGGKTLAEVILEIRRLLLVDNRELVILVEDFAALVGIQDTLAKVLIQEGETSKGKEFATIRSAIAVTDGYLAGRDTLATRVGKEWVVESRLESEDETLRRTKSLVASYLNAARFGEAGLKKHYQQAAMEAGSSDTRWLPPVYSEDGEEDGEILRAFGYEGKVPLFPFTEAAIECLARATLTTGNVLVFSPRFVIKNIIREILMAGREAFAHKQFPPPGITTKKPSADVAQWLASLHVSDDQRKRYERLVTVWGNDPQTRSDIGCIPREVFEVFGLPQPEIEYIPPKPKQDSSAVKPTDIAPPEIASRQEQQIKGCQTALESWVQNGTKLEQSIANEIRKALETLMNQRIDWNAERCLKREFFRTQFSIPNAGGEGNLASDVIKIAPSSDDPDGRLRGELIALLRYFWVYKDAPDYEGVDDDLARIANLVDRLLPDALEIVRVTVKKQNQSAILALAANSRLLGINERGRTVGAISSFLFGDVGVIEALPDTAPQTFKDWRDLQSSAVQIRSQLRQLLLDTSGCFQGTTGKTAYGIDIVRLMENYPDDKATIEFASLAGLAPELRQSLQNMSDVKVSARLNQVLQDTRKIQKLITEDLGVDIDKQVVADIFKELTATLREMGAWSPSEIGISVNEFTALCEAFRTAAIKESLSILQGFDSGGEDQTSAKKVTLGAQLPLFPLLTTERFLNFANKVIRAADAHAQALESQYDGISPSEKAQEIQCAFNELIENLVTLQIGEV